MTSPFRRLAPPAQKLLFLAQSEARALQHKFIGPQHLLLALLADDEQARTALGVDHGTIRRIVQDMVTPHGAPGADMSVAYLPLAPHMRTLLEQAAELADELGSEHIDRRHLLMCLVREDRGFVPYVLARAGTSGAAVYAGLAEAPRARPERAQPGPGRSAGQGSEPVLPTVGTDLTQAARDGLLDPVIGRSTEIARTMQVLRRRSKNNVVLLGEPGVGKTAIVEGLAQQLAGGVLPAARDTRVWSVDVGSLLAGAIYRGQFEERLSRVIDEVIAEDAILFIDELHMIIGAGSTENSVDAANILKPALARGKLKLVGATTFEEYSQHIEKDAALRRRFQPLVIEEPSIDETVSVLRGVRHGYEVHHALRFSEEALDAAARLSARYVPDMYLPGKAIDLLDEAASRVWYRRQVAPPGSEAAAETMVTEHDVVEVLSSQTGIPGSRLSGGLDTASGFESFMRERVAGQRQAIAAVAKAVRRITSGLGTTGSAVPSLLLVGPPGVGKSHFAKAMAEYLLGGQGSSLLRLDMSEYAEAHTVSRLVGAPPGYVGYDQGGRLTEAIRRRPYSVVLLDHVDRAHPDVLQLLVELLEEGRLTDARGRLADFRNATVLMTVTLPPESQRRKAALGFAGASDAGEAGDVYQRRRQEYLEQAGAIVDVDFFRCVETVAAFESLEQADVERLVLDAFSDVRRTLEARDIGLDIRPGALSVLASNGYHDDHGAHGLRSAVEEHALGRIVEGVVAGACGAGDVVVVAARGDAVEVVVRSPAGHEVPLTGVRS